MRLKHLKLAGFKSFVDPTKIVFTDAMSAVVGPNGCGKSNIIDAVRWVLGESSAKNLRGEGMTDVIFNGSNARKPVSVASVELMFDNSDGKASGPWASYSEIAIKRQVNRDGQSDYFVNGQKCRRRDISDLLSGTGLGPRSYSIIEQGTISRLVESKPQELRVFIEEAAGITKYKERKRDTENRIKHSRENLSRLADLRHELQVQIDSLETQAKLAQDYTQLKSAERELNSHIIVSRWQSFFDELSQAEKNLTQCQTQMSQLEQGLMQLEQDGSSREQQLEQQRVTLNSINDECHRTETNLARLQLSIEHLNQNALQLLNKQSALGIKLDGLTQQRDSQLSALEQASQLVEQSTNQLPPLQDNQRQVSEGLGKYELEFEQSDQAYSQLLHEKQRINGELLVARQGSEQVKQDQIKLTSQLDMLKHKQVELLSDQQKLNPKVLEQQVQHQQQQLLVAQQQVELTAQEINSAQQHLLAQQQVISEYQRQHSQLSNQQATFELLLQQHSQGENSSLGEHYHQSTQLWQQLDVTPQWQTSVEIVFDRFLLNYIVDELPAGNLLPCHGVIINQPVDALITQVSEISSLLVPITEVINCSHANLKQIVDNICHDIYCVDSVELAHQLINKLTPGQSVITPCGCWFGHGFAQLGTKDDNKAKNSILALEQQRIALLPKIDDIEQALVLAQNKRETLAQQSEICNQNQIQFEQTLREKSEIAIEGKQRWLLEQQQWQHIVAGLSDIKAQTEHANQLFEIDNDQKQSYKQQARLLTHTLSTTEEQIKLTQGTRHIAKQQVKTLQSKEQQAQQAVHQQQLSIQKHQLKHVACQNQLEHMTKALEELTQELNDVTSEHKQQQDPLKLQQQQLSDYQRQLFTLKEQQTQQQLSVKTASEQGVEQTKRRQQLAQDKDKLQLQIAKLKVKQETLKVKISAQEQALALGQREMAQLALALPDIESSKSWQSQLGDIQDKLAKMGAINLTAIEQYNEQKERLDYLTAQSDDLEQGLKTLESAIRKIDRQSREKFKTTFDSVNRDFKVLFPKVFGGGSAQLTLTDSDLLLSGVSIMAQPPGKKNSTIALLSGGEKALTALSLVFAIFQLNPAPFCMLDEVDAPLDDANVDRFCNLVKEMSETVQFIYITHNKVSMEMATQLTGVTMQEAGVSRVVTVDVDMAVSLTQE